MADTFLAKYMSSSNKIATVIEAGSSDPAIKKKILNYIIEDSSANKAAYLAAIEVFQCGISNNFIKRSDISLDQIEKRLINLAVKHRNDESISESLCSVIVRIFNMFISQKDTAAKNYETKFTAFFSNIATLSQKPKDIPSNVIALSLLRHALLVWEDFYTICSGPIVLALKKLFEMDVSHPLVHRVALCVLQQQPTPELRSFAPLIPKLVKSIYSSLGLSQLDMVLIASLEDAIVQQSILFRKEFQFILTTVRERMADASIPSKNYQGAIKSMLLLFDKQKDFLLKETQNKQGFIKSVLSVLFDYLAKQQNNNVKSADEQTPKKKSIKSESIVSSPAYQITQFVLTQLRDLSKILSAKNAVAVYKEIFSSMLKQNAFAAFIGFSTIGEYGRDVSDLEEYAVAAQQAIRKGDSQERFAALNGVMLLCDFLGSKFTSHFEKTLLREGLLASLVELSNEERAAVYSALTLFIGNLGEASLKKEDLRTIVEMVTKDIKEASSTASDVTKYYALICIDSLAEKFTKDLSGFADKLYALVKRVDDGACDELRVMRIEVQANFMKIYGEESAELRKDFDALIKDVLVEESKSTIEVFGHQINVLFKLTKAAAAMDLLNEKRNQLIKEILRVVEPAVQALISRKKQEEQNEDENDELVGQHKEGDQEETESDLNAPRHAFAALQMLFEQSNDDAAAFQATQVCLKVLEDLNDHLSVRDSVLEVLPSLLQILKSANHSGFQECVHDMIKSIVSNLQQETDHGAVLDQLELIGKTLQSVGKCFDSVEIVKNIMIFLFEVCEGAAQAVSNEATLGKKVTIKGGDDDDSEEDDEEEEEEEPHDLQLVQLVGPIIEQIYRTHPEEAYQCFDEIICERVMGICESEDERFKLVGFNVLSNLLTIYDYSKIKDYLEEIFAFLTEGVSLQSFALRQTCVFGLGMLCQIIPQSEFKSYARYLQGAIMHCIMTEDQVVDEEEGDDENDGDDDDDDEGSDAAENDGSKGEGDDEDEEEFGYFMDNSISALGKLIKYQNVTKELGPLIDLIPLKFDEEEALVCHENLLDLVIEKRIGKEFQKEMKDCLQRIEECPFINDAIRNKLSLIKVAAK